MARPHAPTRPRQPSTNQADRWVAVVVALGILTLVAGLWAWSRLQGVTNTERPKPAWLGISRVMAQLTDGRMLKLRVDLHLPDEAAVNELSAQQDALHAVVEEASGAMSHDDLTGPQGMPSMARHIRAAVNAYLAEQRSPHRVKSVLFEEWTLLPG